MRSFTPVLGLAEADPRFLIERLLAAQQTQQEVITKIKGEAWVASGVPAKEPSSGQADSSLVVYGVADVNVTSE